MTELYIFSQDDKLLDILTESTGLNETNFREELNRGSTFTFTVDASGEKEIVDDNPDAEGRNLSQSASAFIGTMEGISTSTEIEVSPSRHVVEENQVVFRDKEGDLRLFVIKEIDDIDNIDGPQTTATCEPAFMELREHIVVDRRFVNQTANTALNAALVGTRWMGQVEVSLGNATTNFYYIDSVEAIWDIIATWGGEFKDVVEFEGNKITARKIILKQRRGGDKGKRFEIDHDIEEIHRTVLSYPVTALYGRGASLEINNDEGEHTGGYTRLINFADIVWKKSSGDPVDKPKGQEWVGDHEALTQYGRLHNGNLLHRSIVWQDGDYEEPAELLQATWNQLQAVKKPEVNYQMTVHLLEQIAGYEHEKVILGDTSFAIDRKFSRPIEIQARVIAIEYDILDIENTAIVEMGQFLSAHDVDLSREVDDLKEAINRPRPTKPITDGNFPDIVPGIPVNIKIEGGYRVIQLYWDYDSRVNISHYEVYGSQAADFVPYSQHLLWRGRVSAFVHTVNTDQTWYYYLRAVNKRGTASGFSQRVSATSIRVISDDILFGSLIADHFKDGLDIASKLAQNSIDFINRGPMEAIDYTQEQIIDSETRLLDQLNNGVGDVNLSIDDLRTRTSGIEGTIINVVQDINTIDGILSSAIIQLANLDGVVSTQGTAISQQADLINAKAERSEVYSIYETDDLLGDKVEYSVYSNKMTNLDFTIDGLNTTVSNTNAKVNDLTGEISNAQSEIANLDIRADGIEQNVSRIETDFDGRISSAVGSITTLAGQVSLKASQISVDGVTGRMSNAESAISVLSGDILLKVDVDGVVASINLSPEGIRIDGNRHHITGQTLIDDAVIGTLALANGSVTNLKIGTGAVDTLQVKDGAINNAKIANLNADKINAGAIRGIDIYGAKFRSSSGTDLMEIVGGNINLTKANGQTVEINPDGMVSRNANNSIRFEVNRFRVRSNALTAYDSNVYLAPKTGNEVRVVRESEIPGDGFVESYTYQDVRAAYFIGEGLSTNASKGFVNLALRPEYDNGEVRVYRGASDRFANIRANALYANIININPQIDEASNIYIRPNEEVRITASGSTTAYRDLRIRGIYASHITVNGHIEQTNLYVRAFNEIRATSVDSTTNYIGVRADGFYGNSLNFNTSVSGVNMYIRASSTGSLYVTRLGNDNARAAVYASSFNESSSRDYKTNIKSYTESALDVINSLIVVNYNFKDDLENGINDLMIGFISEDSPSIATLDKKAIQAYKVSAYNTKAIQEIDTKVINIEDRLDVKDLEIQFLRQKIQQLEEKMTA